jgi:hypothetical protein
MNPATALMCCREKMGQSLCRRLLTMNSATALMCCREKMGQSLCRRLLLFDGRDTALRCKSPYMRTGLLFSTSVMHATVCGLTPTLVCTHQRHTSGTSIGGSLCNVTNLYGGLRDLTHTHTALN